MLLTLLYFAYCCQTVPKNPWGENLGIFDEMSTNSSEKCALTHKI